jgi:c-di-GMP-binding flagellar brake protein YcgR
MTDPLAERRQHDRKPLRVPAELIFPNHPPVPVRLLDVSAGGVGVLASSNPPLGARLAVRFSVPSMGKGASIVEAPVQVAHSVLSGTHGGFVVGLQFTSLSPQSSMAIIKFLKGQ